MLWDIFIAALLAVLAAFTAGLAGHLAATETWQKWAFWGSGILMICLIVIQTYRNEIVQGHLENQITHIQKNTEPIPSHAHLDFFQTSVPDDARLNPFKKGQVADVNILFKANEGIISASVLKAVVLVVPVEDFDGARIASYKERIEAAHPIVSGTLMSSEPGNWRTFYSDPLTSDEVKTLNANKAGICAIGIMSWRDDSGKYETDTGRCYAIETDGSPQWHELSFNNHETKVP